MGGAFNNQSKVGLPMICMVYESIMVNFYNKKCFLEKNKTKLNGVKLLTSFMIVLTEPLKTLIRHQIKQRITQSFECIVYMKVDAKSCSQS